MMKKLVPLLIAAVVLFSLMLPAFAAEESAVFSDVAEDAEYAEAVRWAAEHGYINGYTDGRFGISDPVTRAQLAAILYRFEGSPAASGITRFTDIQATAYYVDAASWAADSGLVNGYPDGRFGVNDPVTRQQMAAILWRYAGQPASAGNSTFHDAGEIASYAQEAVNWTYSNNIISEMDGNLFAPNGNATRIQVAVALYQFAMLDADTADEGDRTQILFTAGGTEIAVTLDDSALAQELWEHLPVTVSMTRLYEREYYGTSLPWTPSAEYETQVTFTPGDLAYWPRGNSLALFFNESSEHPTVDSGIVVIGKIQTDLSVFDGLGNMLEMMVSQAGPNK